MERKIERLTTGEEEKKIIERRTMVKIENEWIWKEEGRKKKKR